MLPIGELQNLGDSDHHHGSINENNKIQTHANRHKMDEVIKGFALLNPSRILPHVHTRATALDWMSFISSQGIRPCTPPGCRPGPASAPSLRSDGTSVGFTFSTFYLNFIFNHDIYFKKYKK